MANSVLVITPDDRHYLRVHYTSLIKNEKARLCHLTHGYCIASSERAIRRYQALVDQLK